MQSPSGAGGRGDGPGAAFNEGRALFAGDREFGQWKQNALSQVGGAEPKADDEVAACAVARERGFL